MTVSRSDLHQEAAIAAAEAVAANAAAARQATATAELTAHSAATAEQDVTHVVQEAAATAEAVKAAGLRTLDNTSADLPTALLIVAFRWGRPARFVHANAALGG